MKTHWEDTVENSLMAINVIAWLDFIRGWLRYKRLVRFEWIGNPSGYDVFAVLRRYHIHPVSAGVHIERDANDRRQYRKWLWVNAEQSDFAEYVLMAASVPLTAVRNQQNAKAWGKGRPISWDERKGRRGLPRATAIETIADWMSSLM